MYVAVDRTVSRSLIFAREVNNNISNSLIRCDIDLNKYIVFLIGIEDLRCNDISDIKSN